MGEVKNEILGIAIWIFLAVFFNLWSYSSISMWLFFTRLV